MRENNTNLYHYAEKSYYLSNLKNALKRFKGIYNAFTLSSLSKYKKDIVRQLQSIITMLNDEVDSITDFLPIDTKRLTIDELIVMCEFDNKVKGAKNK